MEQPESLAAQVDTPSDVALLDGFITEDDAALRARHAALGLAMSLEDFSFTRDYFRDEEKRDPSITEIKMLDTYWSDHCRHTTFATELTDIQFQEVTEEINEAH